MTLVERVCYSAAVFVTAGALGWMLVKYKSQLERENRALRYAVWSGGTTAILVMVMLGGVALTTRSLSLADLLSCLWFVAFFPLAVEVASLLVFTTLLVFCFLALFWEVTYPGANRLLLNVAHWMSARSKPKPKRKRTLDDSGKRKREWPEG
jgi:hypothetical protein